MQRRCVRRRRIWLGGCMWLGRMLVCAGNRSRRYRRRRTRGRGLIMYSGHTIQSWAGGGLAERGVCVVAMWWLNAMCSVMLISCLSCGCRNKSFRRIPSISHWINPHRRANRHKFGISKSYAMHWHTKQVRLARPEMFRLFSICIKCGRYCV